MHDDATHLRTATYDDAVIYSDSDIDDVDGDDDQIFLLMTTAAQKGLFFSEWG